VKQIRLSKGLFALVSPEDYEWLIQWKWCASHESRGTKHYAIRFEKKEGVRRKVRMHREIMNRMTSWSLSGGLVVDHDNHNGLDNRRENLSLISQRENMLKSPGWKRRTVG